jgi:hypothetical protein
MKLIVLTGLVAVEKAELALELAEHYVQNGQSVTVLDNIARIAIQTNAIPVWRIEGDSLTQLSYWLTRANSDVVIFVVSEQVHPDTLFVALDNLHNQFDTIEIQTLALIDTRTCDCFPHVRESLEEYADVVVMLPYSLDEVLNDVSP